MNETFWKEFKQTTEKNWGEKTINPSIFGFQIQPQTKWLPGHTEQEIRFLSQQIVGEKLHEDIINLLKFTKGLDKQAYNANPTGGQRVRQQWKLNINYLKQKYDDELDVIRREHSMKILSAMLGQTNLKYIPIYSHRFIVQDNSGSYKVYSIFGEDVIVYAETLVDYLNSEFI